MSTAARLSRLYVPFCKKFDNLFDRLDNRRTILEAMLLSRCARIETTPLL
jgi:hypothetical protein